MTAEEFIKLNVIDGHPSCFKCNMVTEKDALKAVEMARSEKTNPLVGLQGWICPKCGRVYSPYTSCCSFCGNFDFSKVTCSTTQEQFGSPAKIQQPISDKMQ